MASVLVCVTGHAQSRLNFPIVLSGNDLATTGIALVNTSASPVLANLNFYGTDGQPIVTQYPLNIPSGGQLARLASEMIPKTNASGWIQIVAVIDANWPYRSRIAQADPDRVCVIAREICEVDRPVHVAPVVKDHAAQVADNWNGKPQL